MKKMTLAEWVKTNRENLNMSQAELERLSELGEKYITKMENGHPRKPQEQTRAAIHRVFGTNDQDLADVGILQRMENSKEVWYVYPKSGAIQQGAPAELVSTAQAMREIREEADGVRWTRTMLNAVLSQVRAFSEIQSPPMSRVNLDENIDE